jgi:internalin A
MVAKAGDPVVALLSPDSDYSSEEAGNCVEALALIGTDQALAMIAQHSADQRSRVSAAIGRAWNSFDATRYREIILAGRNRLTLPRLPGPEQLQPLEMVKRLQIHEVKPTEANLSGIGFLRNLEELELSGTELPDLNGFVMPTSLRYLSIGWTPVEDLTPVSGLAELERLDIAHTKIRDLSPLAKLRKLEWLDFAGTDVADVSPITEIDTLKRIAVNGEQLTTIRQSELRSTIHHLDYADVDSEFECSVLREFTCVESLWIYCAQRYAPYGLSFPGQLTPLAALNTLESQSSLSELVLGGWQVDLSEVATINHLERLNLIMCEIVKGVSLDRLDNLKLLMLSSCTGFQPEALAGLQSLQRLAIRYSHLLDLNPLARLVGLEELILFGIGRPELHPLSILVNLKHLEIGVELARDLAPIADLPNLQRLVVWGSGRIDRKSLSHRPDVVIERI